jgi:type II secretion system protein J
MTGERRTAFATPVSARAFTLLELLLALALAAILAASLLASVHIAFKARRTAEAALRPTKRGESAMVAVCTDLESALPPRGVFAGSFSGFRWADDRGQPGDSVSFCATAPGPVHGNGTVRGDVKKIELTTATIPATGEHVLVRRVRTNLLEPVVTDPDEEILCRNVLAFALRYSDGLLWHDEWPPVGAEQGVLPAAVEVTLELEPLDNADANRPLRFTRVVAVSCIGKVDDGGGGSGNEGGPTQNAGENPQGPQHQGPPGGG